MAELIRCVRTTVPETAVRTADAPSANDRDQHRCPDQQTGAPELSMQRAVVRPFPVLSPDQPRWRGPIRPFERGTVVSVSGSDARHEAHVRVIVSQSSFMVFSFAESGRALVPVAWVSLEGQGALYTAWTIRRPEFGIAHLPICTTFEKLGFQFP